MCGITAYSGKKLALKILLTGLKRLEYRGYDGYGLVLLGAGQPAFYRTLGKLQDLENKVKNNNLRSSLGMAHNRWATHGGITEANTHPHVSQSQDLIIVHNGIVENYLVIKQKLESEGFIFYSETDTEVLVNFIEFIKIKQKLDLMNAIQVALSEITGACTMIIYSQMEDCLVAVNRGGQLFAGIDGEECFIASDKNAFAGYSEEFFEINDQVLVVKGDEKPQLLGFNLKKLKPIMEKLSVAISQLTKGQYPSFMLKEIYEQPEIMRQGMAGRINFQTQEICFGGLNKYWDQIKEARSLIIVACGTSWHAGLLAKYWLEKLVNISVRVEYASEFQATTIKLGDIVLGISQSGTTADTLVALEAAKSRGAITLGICNSVNSKMARLVNAGIYTRAGVENGVASTKAFTAQALALLLFALKLAQDKKTISVSEFNRIIAQLEVLPALMEQALGSEKVIRTLARKLKHTTNCLFLGRGYSFPVALEGALKLKEISYVHAEGLPAGESKHGPLALIDEFMPVIVMATQGEFYRKTLSNISEVKSHGGRVIALVNKDDSEVAKLTGELIFVPFVVDILSPFINIIPLQLFAYYSAFSRGKDVDHPRNLAKSVTTE